VAGQSRKPAYSAAGENGPTPAARTKLTLESLEHITKDELRAAWTRVTGKPPLRIQSHEFLLMSVAWELQARQFGGLKPAVRRKLESLATAYQQGEAPPRSAQRPRYRPGTVLTKDWHGTSHTITVLDDGYAYQGTPYKSLSEIARLITGTRWNGPAFFGLRRAKDRRRADG
jgi:hypothetical protein